MPSFSAFQHPNRVGITAPSGDTSDRLATTEFVNNAITGVLPGLRETFTVVSSTPYTVQPSDFTLVIATGAATVLNLPALGAFRMLLVLNDNGEGIYADSSTIFTPGLNSFSSQIVSSHVGGVQPNWVLLHDNGGGWNKVASNIPFKSNYLWADLGNSTTVTLSGSGTTSVVPLSHVQSDVDVTFKSSNSSFNPNIEGNFLICGNVRINAQSSAAPLSDVAASIIKNGTPILYGSDVVIVSSVAALADQHIGMESHISAIVPMSGAGDSIQLGVFIQTVGGSSVNLEGTNSLTWFTASRMP